MYINDDDAVIVLKPDGTFESSIPEFENDNIPEHLIISAAIVYALQTPQMLDYIEQKFLEDCKDIKEEGKDVRRDTFAAKDDGNVINIWDKLKNKKSKD